MKFVKRGQFLGFSEKVSAKGNRYIIVIAEIDGEFIELYYKEADLNTLLKLEKLQEVDFGLNLNIKYKSLELVSIE